MKAVVCREHGLPDRLDLVDDWPSPELGDNEVRIRVKAAGLNFPDVLIIQGKYQFQPELPFIPGGECAGVVEEVGAAVTRWKVGDEVILNKFTDGGHIERPPELAARVKYPPPEPMASAPMPVLQLEQSPPHAPKGYLGTMKETVSSADVLIVHEAGVPGSAPHASVFLAQCSSSGRVLLTWRLVMRAFQVGFSCWFGPSFRQLPRGLQHLLADTEAA